MDVSVRNVVIFIVLLLLLFALGVGYVSFIENST